MWPSLRQVTDGVGKPPAGHHSHTVSPATVVTLSMARTKGGPAGTEFRSSCTVSSTRGWAMMDGGDVWKYSGGGEVLWYCGGVGGRVDLQGRW